MMTDLIDFEGLASCYVAENRLTEHSVQLTTNIHYKKESGDVMAVGNKAVHTSSLWMHVRKEWKLYSFLVIPVLYFLIFKYAPMLGNVIAFRKYRGGPNLFGSEWVGLSYFRKFMNDPTFWRAFKNDLVLSVTYLCFRFPLTLIFALLLNELVRMRVKKLVQTISYLPHFISMVIVAGMIKEMVSLNGPINARLANLGFSKIAFISLPQWFPTIYVTSGIWQGLGWGTILYLAAMTSINTELYEAAKIDGASRFRLALHVTIPGILPTIMTLLILDIGGILGSNFEKILLLYNPLTYETADVISTYVYRMGITGGNFSFATAVGLFEGVIGLILVTIANQISKKTTNSSLW
jgi:putative aldouronate transport system permease protein